jgi:hypothetical protein
VRILRRNTERKIEDVFGEDLFGFRRGNGNSDVVGMLKIISKQLWTWLRNYVLPSKRHFSMYTGPYYADPKGNWYFLA